MPEKSAVPTVLLIDDEPMLLRLWSHALRRRGYCVFTARGRDDALALLRQDGAAVDVLVCDVCLSAENGLQVVADLRGCSRLSGASLIFVTGHDPAGVPEPEWIGSTPVLQKPFSLRKLTATIEELGGLAAES